MGRVLRREAVAGLAWLTVALVFFSSGLYCIALLPYSEDNTASAAADVFLRVRQTDARLAVREFLTQHEPAILAFPVLVFAAFFGLQLAFPARTTTAVDAAAATVLRGGDPVFLAAVFLAVCYCLVLLVGPWGDITLGGPETEPSYTYLTYLTLVFTAGIAAGLVFWGPTEALFQYD